MQWDGRQQFGCKVLNVSGGREQEVAHHESWFCCVCDSSQIRRWIGMLQNADTTSKGCSTHHRVILHTQKHNRCFTYDTTLLSL